MHHAFLQTHAGEKVSLCLALGKVARAEFHDKYVLSQGARAAAGPIQIEPAHVNITPKSANHPKQPGMQGQPCFNLHDA
jgi:hypothetical protein